MNDAYWLDQSGLGWVVIFIGWCFLIGGITRPFTGEWEVGMALGAWSFIPIAFIVGWIRR